MAGPNNTAISKHFMDEKLKIHWQVDQTPESFRRLLYHLEVKTSVRPCFEEAVNRLWLDGRKDAVVADIGSGTCWTSAIIAKHDNIRLVYAVEPSLNRLKCASFVIRHFGVEKKVMLVSGTFLNPNVPEKVDYVVLCSSLHHCYDRDMAGLFLNIKNMLKPGGAVLVANEHYIDWLWILKRVLSYAKHYAKRSKLYYYPIKKLRQPDPSGNHWRTKRQLMSIFESNGFIPEFHFHEGDMSKDKPTFLGTLGWHYYNAILRLKR